MANANQTAIVTGAGRGERRGRAMRIKCSVNLCTLGHVEARPFKDLRPEDFRLDRW